MSSIDFNLSQLDLLRDCPESFEVIEEGEFLINQLKFDLFKISDKEKKEHLRKQISYHNEFISDLRKKLLIGNGKHNTEHNAEHNAEHNINQANKGLEMLIQSNKNLIETESCAIDTLNELQKQKHTIVNATNNINTVISDLSSANSLLNRMKRRF